MKLLGAGLTAVRRDDTTSMAFLLHLFSLGFPSRMVKFIFIMDVDLGFIVRRFCDQK